VKESAFVGLNATTTCFYLKTHRPAEELAAILQLQGSIKGMGETGQNKNDRKVGKMRAAKKESESRKSDCIAKSYVCKSALAPCCLHQTTQRKKDR